MVHGRCRQLTSQKPFSVPKAKQILNIIVPGDIHIPSNAHSETIKRVGGEDRQHSTISNIAVVEAAGLSFEIERADGWLSITALSDSIITSAIKIRILEAIQFVLARPLHWCVMQCSQDGQKETTLRAAPSKEPPPNKYPPISLHTDDDSVWELYKLYLENYIEYEREQWHPTFSSIYRILQLGSVPISTEALALSVALEGVIKSEFNNIGITTKAMNDRIKETSKIINSCRIDQNIKDRITSALGQMTQPRAKDRLYVLCNEGLICKQHVKAWEKLRNSTAHADELDGDSLREFLGRIHSTYVLIYHLIFLSIGYTGAYTDYSDRFSLKRFSGEIL